MTTTTITPSKKRLSILQNSLAKKEAAFDDRLQSHFDDVRSANGQPLNDKRNGRATLNRWERQNNALRTLNQGIEKTKAAIEKEQRKIAHIEATPVPAPFVKMVEEGTLIQWRKHPNTFFVAGVDKVRIVWDLKKNILCHRYVDQVKDPAQYETFRTVIKELFLDLKEAGAIAA